MGDVIEQFAVGSLSIQRWRRFGMDRLYVEAEGGRKVGWVDLETGESAVESPDDEEFFRHALSNWQAVLPLGQALVVEAR